MNPGGDREAAEGGAVDLVGDVTGDVTSTTWSYRAVEGGATCTIADPNAVNTRISCDDDGVYEVTLTVSNGTATASGSFRLTVRNAPPQITLTGPGTWSAHRAGTTATVTATVRDPGGNDTVTCRVAWDDGTSTTAAPAADGTCTLRHRFRAAGMYTVRVSATDDDGGSRSAQVLLVAFDPRTWAAGAGSLAPPGEHRPPKHGSSAHGQRWHGSARDGSAWHKSGWHRSGWQGRHHDRRGRDGRHDRGGWFSHASARENVHRSPHRREPAGSFAFSAAYRHHGGHPAGGVRVWVPSADLKISARRLDWLVVTPAGEVALRGRATTRAGAPVAFVVYAHPGHGRRHPARFRLVVWDAGRSATPENVPLIFDSAPGASFDLDAAAPPLVSGVVRAGYRHAWHGKRHG